MIQGQRDGTRVHRCQQEIARLVLRQSTARYIFLVAKEKTENFLWMLRYLIPVFAPSQQQATLHALGQTQSRTPKSTSALEICPHSLLTGF